MSDDFGPPPSYSEAVSSGPIASDPMLPRIQGSQPDNRYTVSQVPLDTTDSLDDSPHSSDDEETTRLKADLRRLREEKKSVQHDERLAENKILLKQAIEREQTDIQAASGSSPAPLTSYPLGEITPSAPLPQSYPPPVIYTCNPAGPCKEYGTTGPLHDPELGVTPAIDDDILTEKNKMCNRCIGYGLGLVIAGIIIFITFIIK